MDLLLDYWCKLKNKRISNEEYITATVYTLSTLPIMDCSHTLGRVQSAEVWMSWSARIPRLSPRQCPSAGWMIISITLT